MEKTQIVIADDNERILQLLEEILKTDEEIEIVGKAKNGEEAIDIISEKQPDVALLDVIMPKFDGLAVMEKIFANKQENEGWSLDIGKKLLHHYIIKQRYHLLK